jgi:hypothetical protein
MLNKFTFLAVGTVLSFGTLGFSGGDASAAAMLPFSLLSSQQNVANDGMIQQAASRSDRRMRSNWEAQRDGRRCSRREGHCRHFHDGYYYETPWWTLPLIIGGGIGYDDGGYGRLSCGEARARVRHSGFRNVSTIECNGRTYTFEATRRGRDVTVYVNSRTGAVWRG